MAIGPKCIPTREQRRDMAGVTNKENGGVMEVKSSSKAEKSEYLFNKKNQIVVTPIKRKFFKKRNPDKAGLENRNILDTILKKLTEINEA